MFSKTATHFSYEIVTHLGAHQCTYLLLRVFTRQKELLYILIQYFSQWCRM